MTEKKSAAGGYEVGKGKPPAQHRWQKGQSGNPSGKRKNPKTPRLMTMGDYFAEALAEQVPMRVGDKTEVIPAGKAVARKVLRGLLKAEDGRETKYHADVLIKFGGMSALEDAKAKSETRSDSPDGIFTEEHRRLLEIARDDGFEGDEANEDEPEETSGGGVPAAGSSGGQGNGGDGGNDVTLIDDDGDADDDE
jgi:hypothetical protein